MPEAVEGEPPTVLQADLCQIPGEVSAEICDHLTTIITLSQREEALATPLLCLGVVVEEAQLHQFWMHRHHPHRAGSLDGLVAVPFGRDVHDPVAPIFTHVVNAELRNLRGTCTGIKHHEWHPKAGDRE